MSFLCWLCKRKDVLCYPGKSDLVFVHLCCRRTYSICLRLIMNGGLAQLLMLIKGYKLWHKQTSVNDYIALKYNWFYLRYIYIVLFSLPLIIRPCPCCVATVGQPDFSVLDASWHPSWVWGSADDDAALPASAQDLQAGTPDEEGGAGGSQRIQGDFSG